MRINARVDAKGRPVGLLISPGEVHDVACVEAPLDGLKARAGVIADRGCDQLESTAWSPEENAESAPDSARRFHRLGDCIFFARLNGSS
jgi:hypothetical protein